ncbi:MAG: crotonase/enoyl-CoA hydratase family protein [Woeseiaceae bacterium]|nr:crotonase/enoyl-CoA hydratase family protein [Woeseiaceae bacterium]
MSERVAIDIDGHVAEVRLNRPDKHNAIDLAMFEALSEAAKEVAANNAVRAVVLTGAGENFCAGIDMGMFQTQFDYKTALATPLEPSPANLFQRPGYAWRELPQPVICAIRGVCYGGGLQIAAGADIRYATADARLSILEIKWGLIPDMSMTTTLRDVVPVDKVKELTFTGRVFDGNEALQLGVVTALHDDPLAAARELAQVIASKSPDAIRRGKKLINAAWNLADDEALQLEARLQGEVIGEPNQMEAVMANFEKRPPEFRD